jgi:hypothetical protein
MIRDTELHDRFLEAADAYRTDVSAALGSLAGTVRARRRRHLVMAVGAAAVISVLAAGWATLGATTHRLQPVQPPVQITPPPDGVTSHQSVALLEAKVLAQIANDESRAGTSVGRPRILSVTYLPPGNSVFGVGTTGAPAAWAVEFHGTYLQCFASCTAQSGGVLVFDDLTGDQIGPASSFIFAHGGGYPAICEAYQLEVPRVAASPHSVANPPAGLRPCLPTTFSSQP